MKTTIASTSLVSLVVSSVDGMQPFLKGTITDTAVKQKLIHRSPILLCIQAHGNQYRVQHNREIVTKSTDSKDLTVANEPLYTPLKDPIKDRHSGCNQNGSICQVMR